MIQAIVKLRTSPARRTDILDVLRTVVGPTRVEPGCLGCSLYQDDSDAEVIVLLQEWGSRGDLDHYLRSDLCLRILQAAESAQGPPEVRFMTVSDTSGIEAVAAARESATKVPPVGRQ